MLITTKVELLAEIADVPDDAQVWVVRADGLGTNNLSVVGQEGDEEGGEPAIFVYLEQKRLED